MWLLHGSCQTSALIIIKPPRKKHLYYLLHYSRPIEFLVYTYIRWCFFLIFYNLHIFMSPYSILLCVASYGFLLTADDCYWCCQALLIPSFSVSPKGIVISYHLLYGYHFHPNFYPPCKYIIGVSFYPVFLVAFLSNISLHKYFLTDNPQAAYKVIGSI